MNKKIAELRQLLTAKITEARALNDENKVEEATAKLKEAEALKTQIVNLEALDQMENDLQSQQAGAGGTGATNPVAFDTNGAVQTSGAEAQKNTEQRSALVKALAGKPLSKEERALLIEGTPGAGQTSGSFIVPKDISTEINTYKREYTSLKDYTEVMPTTTNTGTFVYERTSTLTPLVDLTEGTDIAETTLDFDRLSYTLRDKGALLPVSNQLLQDENANLLQYIGRWFARKAVKTENASIMGALTGGKTAVPVPSITELVREMNALLDPALLDGAVLITNQDGFGALSAENDGNGRPLLEPDLQVPTRRIFKGLPVVVLSNANFPSAGGLAPVIVGNLPEAIRFVDRDVYEVATSNEAGFTRNVTYIRCIERYDVVLKDRDAYAYVTIPTAPAV